MADTLDLDGLLIISQKEVYEALRILSSESLFTKLFPTPPTVFAGCSISLAMKATDLKKAKEILENNGVKVLKVVYLNKNVIGEFYDCSGY
ncbi:DUF3343 domain-containing protein [Kosmotoga pacifica]|uniref:Putative Se/S carrier protein-like domain-containing protein n=1 Tax=Kosmotoga pacifica TaxID=1330330 RepID=A0A0G2ZC17_9BACT|nr:DUF3343 domain-containing protein [Kosmotoga pacifica]AKI97104.1 hypothetical protein IX53_03905 [Kosmotoga pacifica]